MTAHTDLMKLLEPMVRIDVFLKGYGSQYLFYKYWDECHITVTVQPPSTLNKAIVLAHESSLLSKPIPCQRGASLTIIRSKIAKWLTDNNIKIEKPK